MGFWTTVGTVGGTLVGTAVGRPLLGAKVGKTLGTIADGSGDKGEDNQQNAQVASKTSGLDVTGLMNPSTVSSLAGSIQVAQGSDPYSLQKTAASWFNPPTERA
tara:strand:+ start:284 stop:595 length:312 start_codon:yes stop_codon:yes gene_type:complete